MAKTHLCPVCGHEIELSANGDFRSHGITGELRGRGNRVVKAPFCRGSVYRVRRGVVLDPDDRPVQPPRQTAAAGGTASGPGQHGASLR